MGYERKCPLDYADIAENLREPAWYDLEECDTPLLDDAAAGIIYQKDRVEVRFLKGRLKFGGAKNSAPFPSMVVVFRPKMEMMEGME